MKKSIKISILLVASIFTTNILTPMNTVLATEKSGYESEDTTEANVVITDSELIINGKSITEEELIALLSSAIETPVIQPRSFAAAAYAGSYFVPGLGQVMLAATGAVIIGGITITAGHWAWKAITNFFSNEDNMTADDIISKRRKGSVRREFPTEYLGKTLGEIKKEANKGNARAKKAKKLLQDGRFKK